MAPPIGIRVVTRCAPSLPQRSRDNGYRIYILLLTFFCYASYHLSRKAISVVKSTWHPASCTDENERRLNRNLSLPLGTDLESNSTPWSEINSTGCKNWAPFSSETSMGDMDFIYLLSYAVAMFFSGQVGDRVNLRYFLFAGMVLSGGFTLMLGLAYFLNIHQLWYFVLAQAFGGMVQSTGWPSVVAVTSNWLGKGNRGLILGLWNAHTSVGNILGSVIPGIWTRSAWGWSFVVPGLIIAGMGFIVLLFLVVDPSDVGCSPPNHHSADPNLGTEEATVDLLAEHRQADYSNSVSTDIPQLRNGIDSTSSGAYENTPAENNDGQAVTLCAALHIPGVVEFALCLFFSKFVCYIFLYWLPFYIRSVHINGKPISRQNAAFYASFFDVGGILGGILAGVISDRTGSRALTCLFMLLLGIPGLWVFRVFGSHNLASLFGLMLLAGAMVNGPYALITTAVSADLGTHKVLRDSRVAKATVAAIIDGTGSLGAALGPYTTGIGLQHANWNVVFYLCMSSLFASALCLVRLCIKEWNLLRQSKTSFRMVFGSS